MPIHNSDIAEIFNRLADMLEIEGANEFRVRAYRNAARVVNDHPQAISAMVDRGESLRQLPGIGKDLEGENQGDPTDGALLPARGGGKAPAAGPAPSDEGRGSRT